MKSCLLFMALVSFAYLGNAQQFGKLTVSFWSCVDLPLDQFEVRSNKGNTILGKTDEKGVFVFKEKVNGDVVVLHPMCVNTVVQNASWPGSDEKCLMKLKDSYGNSFKPSLTVFTCNTDSTVLMPDVAAQFPGGNGAMNKFLMENMHLDELDEYEEIPSKAYLSLVIAENGKVKCVSLKRSSGNYCFDKEVVRVANLFPDFIPGKQGGKNVASVFTFPFYIHFK